MNTEANTFVVGLFRLEKSILNTLAVFILITVL